MARFTKHSAPIRPAFIAAALALAGLGACTSELTEVGPLSDIGVVEGQVREAGLPVPAFVRFSRQYAAELEAEVVVRADSTGWYRAALPLGVYRLTLTMAAGESGASGDQDTVRVGRAVRRLDIERGRARVTVRLPDLYDGPSARISLSGTGQDARAWTETRDGLAAFDLRLLPPDAYAMRLRVNSETDEFFLPGTYLVAGADTLRVGAGDVAYEADLRDRHLSLSGRITGSWQSQGLEMMVGLESMSGRERVFAACDADGSYRLDVLVPEPLRLFSTCALITRWYGGPSGSTATVFNVQPGDHLTGLDMTEGSLRLRFEGPGDLLDNAAQFALRDESGRMLTLSRPEGNPTVVPNLAPGSYRLYIFGHCRSEPWQPQWYEGAADEADAQPVVIEAGGIRDLTIGLLPGGTISGMITATSGAPPYWISLTLRDGDGEPLCDRTSYVEEGRLLLEGLADGTYYLSLLWPGATWWYPGTSDFAEAVPLTIVDRGAVTGLVWPLPSYKRGATP